LCLLLVPFLSASASAASGPSIPGWLRAGLKVHYSEDLNNGAQGYDITDTVVSVHSGVVDGRTYSVSDSPGTADTYYWQCSANGDCPGHSGTSSIVLDEPVLFWVDPSDPVASVRGQGVPFSLLNYLGVSVKTIEGRKYKVGTLYYTSGPRDIQTLTLFFLANNGLLLLEQLSNKYRYLGPDILTWYTGEN
jgi:hypothetical protein